MSVAAASIGKLASIVSATQTTAAADVKEMASEEAEGVKEEEMGEYTHIRLKFYSNPGIEPCREENKECLVLGGEIQGQSQECSRGLKPQTLFCPPPCPLP